MLCGRQSQVRTTNNRRRLEGGGNSDELFEVEGLTAAVAVDPGACPERFGLFAVV
ncbi:MAG: hypothetical protein JWL77_781 [Chthonomonadaceae bacterium]|nr:hypothetical protein [Chthonomonadaceae bacterium]